MVHLAKVHTRKLQLKKRIVAPLNAFNTFAGNIHNCRQ